MPDLIDGAVGGYRVLWGRVNGTWIEVAAGQDVPVCTDLYVKGMATTIPSGFFGSECLSGTSIVTYTP